MADIDLNVVKAFKDMKYRSPNVATPLVPEAHVPVVTAPNNVQIKSQQAISGAVPEAHVQKAISFIKDEGVQLGHELRCIPVLQMVHQAARGSNQNVWSCPLHLLHF